MEEEEGENAYVRRKLSSSLELKCPFQTFLNIPFQVRIQNHYLQYTKLCSSMFFYWFLPIT